MSLYYICKIHLNLFFFSWIFLIIKKWFFHNRWKANNAFWIKSKIQFIAPLNNTCKQNTKKYSSLLLHSNPYIVNQMKHWPTCSSFLLSLFLIQDLPWPCGSISRGKREALVTIKPFWIDSSSLGRPSRFHSEIVALSTNIDTIFRSCQKVKRISFC